jgi:hypothetical protein
MGWWLDSSDMVLVLGVIFSGCTACLIAFCQNMRKSRCRRISCLCFTCDREIESDELILAEEAIEAKKSAPVPAPVPARSRGNSFDNAEPSVRV